MVDTPDFKQISVDANAANDSATQFNSTIAASSNILDGVNKFLSDSSGALKGMLGNLKSVSDAMQGQHQLLQRSATLLGLMGTAALGASKMFKEGFQDTSGIQSFGTQISVLFDTINQFEEPAKAITGVATSLGVPLVSAVQRVGEKFDDFKKRVADAVKGILEGPDAALKFQNSFLQMAAASGNLGTVFDQTGGHLHNLNSLLQTQSEMVSKASEATNTDIKTTTDYYTALGRIPGYLNAQVQATDEAGNHLNMLTAAMKLAHGTGMSETEMVNELTTAFNNYGVNGQKALEFTARITELSQKYKVQLSDTQEYMNHTSNSFKFLGENINSTSRIFESYFGRLRDTGLSSRAATEMTSNLADSLTKTSIAQKAFLSGQTGGPGGLMGAIQIEKDIRDGKASDVMKRVESALKQQFGRIVTQQEAATSEQAASQFVKQRMFLQQGPFGSLAQDEGQATHLLEAFGKPGGVTQEDAQKVLSDGIRKGSEVEQKSYTQLTQVNARLEAIKMLSGIIALGAVQRGTTTAAGGELQRHLIGGIKDSMRLGRDATTAGGKGAQDRSALYMTENMRGVYKAIDHFGDTASAIKKEGSKIINQSMPSQPNLGHVTHATANSNAMGAHNREVTSADRFSSTNSADVSDSNQASNITVTLHSVCPDCHKKYVTNQQQKAINNAPDYGPGF